MNYYRLLEEKNKRMVGEGGLICVVFSAVLIFGKIINLTKISFLKKINLS